MIFPYVLGFYNLRGGLRYATEWVNFSLIKNKDVQVKLEFFKKQKKKKKPENRVIDLNKFNKVG